jgi:hypothetical protein
LFFRWHHSASGQPSPVAASQPVAGNIGKKRFDSLIETTHQSFDWITGTAGPAEKIDLTSVSQKAHGAAALQTNNEFVFHGVLFKEYSLCCQGLLPFDGRPQMALRPRQTAQSRLTLEGCSGK